MKYGRYLMNFLINDSFKDAKNAIANLGDSIQALAIDHIYRQIGISQSDVRYIQRDFSEFYSGDPLRIVLYTEFVKNSVANRMRISPKISVATLVSAVIYNDFDTLNEAFPECRQMIEKWAPVGARDEKSLKILRENGIEAYLTGCFTICFPKRKKEPKKPKVFLVDIPEELVAYIPNYIMNNAEYITHAVQINKYPVDTEENARLESIAQSTLNKYRDEAGLVVTGRLHAAIPCIAMGIPVVFACNNLDFRFEWMDKLIHPYQYGEYQDINWNPDVPNVEDVKQHFLQFFKNALSGNEYRDELQWLDNYYMNRERVETYRYFKTLLRLLDRKYGNNNDFQYVIWGAGFHCDFAYELMNKLYPKARLVAVVDKYKRGTFREVRIISCDDLASLTYDHILVTTHKGKDEAVSWIKQYAPDVDYTLIMSQQMS